jgi:hypothetical protein
MERNAGNLILAYLTLISGLAISAVAVWYSVLGLVSIFAAAAIPIMIMGITLELSKLVATVWLKWNWSLAPRSIKVYLIFAISILMIITSMGIFGFLSRAHLDQAIPTGDVVSQVALIDEKINNERETIANARSLLTQLDKAVTDISSGPGRELRQKDGSSVTENPAERALAVRRAQARDRAALTQTIEESQKRIITLQEQKAPIAAELRKVEAEVGPIKYIAALIYGNNPDQNLLEAAVRYVIIIIVIVFDPLAVVLLLASQYSFQWMRNGPPSNDTPPKSNKRKSPPKNPKPDTKVSPPVETVIEPAEKNEVVQEEVKVATVEETPTQEIKQEITEELKEDYDLKAKPDFVDPAVEEAIKWAEEQKKENETYIQNAEQNQGTMWQKIKAVKNN